MRSSHSLDVVVVGVAAMDMVAQVDRLPRPDEIVLAQHFCLSHGGAGANVAVALSHLDCSVTFMGRVGDDEYGRQLVQAMKEAGVNTEAISVDKTLPTPTCFITIDQKGERTIVALGKAAVLTKVDELDLGIIRQVKALYLSDVAGEVVHVAAREAHLAGATVFYGPGGVIVSRGLEQLLPLLKDVDVFIVSRTEAEKLVPDATAEAAMQIFLQAGASVVVQTLGAQGALVLNAEHTMVVPAPRVETVVDTTGAGDAFAAGLIAAHLKGLDWKKAVRVACNVAAIKIGYLGARSGIPAWTTAASLEETCR